MTDLLSPEKTQELVTFLRREIPSDVWLEATCEGNRLKISLSYQDATRELNLPLIGIQRAALQGREALIKYLSWFCGTLDSSARDLKSKRDHGLAIERFTAFGACNHAYSRSEIWCTVCGYSVLENRGPDAR